MPNALLSNNSKLQAINTDVIYCYAYLVHGAVLSILDLQTIYLTFPLSTRDLEGGLHHYITSHDANRSK